MRKANITIVVLSENESTQGLAIDIDSADLVFCGERVIKDRLSLFRRSEKPLSNQDKEEIKHALVMTAIQHGSAVAVHEAASALIEHFKELN